MGRQQLDQGTITAALFSRIRCMFRTGFVVAQFFQTSHTNKYSSVALHKREAQTTSTLLYKKESGQMLVLALYEFCVKHSLFEFRANMS